MDNILMQKLDTVEKLAQSGKLSRLLHQPLRYLYAQTFLKAIYPNTRKGVFRKGMTFFGQPMQLLLPAATDIYLTGGKTHDSEIRLARFMIRQLHAGDTYVDIGAHFGYFTLLASTLVGKNGKVFAFEAARNTFSILKKNIAGADKVQAMHNAMSDKQEMISFYEFPVLYSEFNSMNIEQFENEGWIKKYKPEKTEVRAVTLDSFTGVSKIVPSLIKIDVEGAEDKVIEGGREFFRVQSSVVVMEFLSESRLYGPHLKAMELLNGWGYRTFAIDKKGELQPVDVLKYFHQQGIESDNIVFKK
jgi:FkbM family methyltransferase